MVVLTTLARGVLFLSLLCYTATSFTWSVKRSNSRNQVRFNRQQQLSTTQPSGYSTNYRPSLSKSNGNRFLFTTSALPLSSANPTTAENYLTMLTCADSTKSIFQGKSVLLTGASGGLGRQLAIELAKCQVRTLILSGRNEDSLNEVAKECQREFMAAVTEAGEGAASATLRTHIVTCDLTDRQSVQDLGQKALQICSDNIGSNTVDVLINNGGVSSRSSFLDTNLEVDERVMQVNFFSGVSLAKAVVPGMVKSGAGGRVIWVSSVQGLVGIPNRTSYAASKFAVQGYCEGLRAELAGSNVSVHVASPGYIRTNLSRSAVTGDGSNYGKMDDTTANGADPKEVAVTILDSVAQGQADFIVAATVSAKAAIWLRLLCPGILRSMLVKRFEKSQKPQEKDKTV